MEYKHLGSTCLLIPEIGLGTWAYTEGALPLRRGIEMGACLIDTAESYGTEAIVGDAIRGIRDKVIVATKVSHNHFRKGDVIRSADQSLRRLGINHIDLYQLHSPNPHIPIEETMGAMEFLVDAGKVRFIGVSNFSVIQLKQAQSALSKGRIASNQVKYSLVARDIEDSLLPYCQENQITVIAYSPLAEGISNIFRRDSAGVIERIAAETGKTTAQLALNWCIHKEAVIAIPKANSVAHIEEDCGASGWSLSVDHIELLNRTFK